MTTIIINDQEILKKYSDYELKLKIINFLNNELKSDTIDLFSVEVNSLDSKVKKAYDESFQDVFIDY